MTSSFRPQPLFSLLLLHCFLVPVTNASYDHIMILQIISSYTSVQVKCALKWFSHCKNGLTLENLKLLVRQIYTFQTGHFSVKNVKIKVD